MQANATQTMIHAFSNPYLASTSSKTSTAGLVRRAIVSLKLRSKSLVSGLPQVATLVMKFKYEALHAFIGMEGGRDEVQLPALEHCSPAGVCDWGSVCGGNGNVPERS